jgi:hypothetical protein
LGQGGNSSLQKIDNQPHEVVAASSGGGKVIFFSDREAQDIKKIKISAICTQKLSGTVLRTGQKCRVDHVIKIRLLNSLT